MLATCILLFFVSFLVGSAPLSLPQVWAGFTGTEEIHTIIVTELRLPRAVLALSVGAALGLTGAVMQCWLRNPLADAGLLGTSSTAALGAVIALYFGYAAMHTLVLPVAAILAALAGVALLAWLIYHGATPTLLILAGLAIQYIAAAGIALSLNFAPNPHAALEIAFWMMGSLKDRSLEHVTLALPFIILGCAMLLPLGRKLDALSLGEATATSLGVNMRTLTFWCMLGSAMAIGASVAVSGVIGFIGLIVPHLLRPVIGSLPSRLLVPSMLAGAALLLAADMLIRAIPIGQELKLGVATSLIGAPFFLYILFRMRRGAL